MSASIKIEKKRKEKLDRFLASLLLKEGVKITRQEALNIMIDYALDNEEDLKKRLMELPPLEDDPAWRMLESPPHWGVKDASRKVDEYIYG